MKIYNTLLALALAAGYAQAQDEVPPAEGAEETEEGPVLVGPVQIAGIADIKTNKWTVDAETSYILEGEGDDMVMTKRLSADVTLVDKLANKEEVYIYFYFTLEGFNRAVLFTFGKVSGDDNFKLEVWNVDAEVTPLPEIDGTKKPSFADLGDPLYTETFKTGDEKAVMSPADLPLTGLIVFDVPETKQETTQFIKLELTEIEPGALLTPIRADGLELPATFGVFLDKGSGTDYGAKGPVTLNFPADDNYVAPEEEDAASFVSVAGATVATALAAMALF